MDCFFHGLTQWFGRKATLRLLSQRRDEAYPLRQGIWKMTKQGALMKALDSSRLDLGRYPIEMHQGSEDAAVLRVGYRFARGGRHSMASMMST